MNGVEFEQALSELAERPFDPAEFPCTFLSAFDKPGHEHQAASQEGDH